MGNLKAAWTYGTGWSKITAAAPSQPSQPLPMSTLFASVAKQPGGASAPASVPAPTGVQEAPEIRDWSFASVTPQKAKGPGIGIAAIGLGAVLLFMLTQKKRKKKR